MRKNIFTVLIFMLLCINSMMAQFTGSGTSSDPYLISSDEDLLNFATAVNAGNDFSGNFFQQTADIDLVDSQIFPSGFTPIGGFDGSKPFSGTYDGGGHSISKMMINGSGMVAMFSNLHDGCVKNLNLENINFNANAYSIVSGLVATAYNSTISNVVVSGQLSASEQMTELSFAGIVGQAERTSISGSLCMLTFDFENAEFNSADVAGIANGDSRTTVTNCFVSTFIRGDYTNYYPIVDRGTATKCLVAESNGMPGEIDDVTYNSCYFDHQNTLIVEFPIQMTFIDGFVAKKTAELISGSLFNDANWTEAEGLYPRPVAVANTNSAILASTPMILNSSDCILDVVSDFMVGATNGVVWDSESSYLQISGENVSLLSHPDSIAEIYAYRNNLVKNIQLFIIGGELGTKGNPYRISSEADLRALAVMFDYSTYMNKSGRDLPGFLFDPSQAYDLYFLVDSDIVISADSEWESIGTYYDEYNFHGHFDGGNHTITFEDGSSYYQPLFGYVSNATISNLTVSYNNANIGSCYTGGFMDEVSFSVISNCKLTGSVVFHMGGECYTAGGGIAGYALNTFFYNCVNEATIFADDASFGGIVGHGENVTIRSCSNIGNMSGDSGYSGTYLSGIIGEASDSYITSCANYGSFADESNQYSSNSAIVGSASNSQLYGCANYGDNIIPLAATATNSIFINNINVPNNICSQSHSTEISTFVLGSNDFDGGEVVVSSVNYIIDNFTDKQLAPFTGNSHGINGLLTADLISGDVEGLSANDWVFVNGRYPMPLGTDLDHRISRYRDVEISIFRRLLGSQNNRGVSPEASPRFGVVAMRINAC